MDKRQYYIHHKNKIADLEAMTARLLDLEILFIGSSEDNRCATLFVNCNDYFGPCADSESISPSEIPILFDLIEEKGEIAVFEFVANKRKVPNKHWRNKSID